MQHARAPPTACSRFPKFHNWINIHLKRGIIPLPRVLIHGVCSCTAIDEMHGRLATGNKGIPLLLTSDCTEFSNRGGHTRRKTDRQSESARDLDSSWVTHYRPTYRYPPFSNKTAFPVAPSDVCMHRLTCGCGNVWNTSRGAIVLLSRPLRHETRGRTTLWRHS